MFAGAVVRTDRDRVAATETAKGGLTRATRAPATRGGIEIEIKCNRGSVLLFNQI